MPEHLKDIWCPLNPTEVGLILTACDRTRQNDHSRHHNSRSISHMLAFKYFFFFTWLTIAHLQYFWGEWLYLFRKRCPFLHIVTFPKPESESPSYCIILMCPTCSNCTAAVEGCCFDVVIFCFGLHIFFEAFLIVIHCIRLCTKCFFFPEYRLYVWAVRQISRSKVSDVLGVSAFRSLSNWWTKGSHLTSYLCIAEKNKPTTSWSLWIWYVWPNSDMVQLAVQCSAWFTAG